MWHALAPNLELRATHLETPHLPRHGGGKARCGVSASGIEDIGGLGKRGLRLLHRTARQAHALAGITGGLDDLPRRVTLGEHIRHAGTVRAHEALERAHALLHANELLRVKIDGVAVVTKPRGEVIDVVERALEGVRKHGKRVVETRGIPQSRDRGGERVHGPRVTRDRLARTLACAEKGLGVLRSRQRLLELLELTLLRVYLFNAPELEGSLLEPLRTGTRELVDALVLRASVSCGGERLAIGGERRGNALPRPRVEHLGVRGGGKQALVLVLATEVDRRAHLLRELRHAGHAPVDLDATAARGLNAAPHDVAVDVIRPEVDAPFDEQVVITFANGAGVRALAHEQLAGAEQRSLARTRLTREHGEARGGHERRIADECHALDVELVNHRMGPPLAPAPSLLLLPHLAIEHARHRVIEPTRV